MKLWRDIKDKHDATLTIVRFKCADGECARPGRIQPHKGFVLDIARCVERVLYEQVVRAKQVLSTDGRAAALIHRCVVPELNNAWQGLLEGRREMVELAGGIVVYGDPFKGNGAVAGVGAEDLIGDGLGRIYDDDEVVVEGEHG